MDENIDAPRTAGAPEFWRSLDERADDPSVRAWLDNEFPDGATEWDDSTRRDFLKVMGASLALAGAAGCSPRAAPNRVIVPYTRAPERVTPGLPLFFASAVPLGGVGAGVLLKSYEGRPVKVEGNPSHPGSLGAADILMQASLLCLYDPDRSRSATFRGEDRSWDAALADLKKLLNASRAKGGEGVVLLTGTVESPTLAASIDALQKDYPKLRHVQYEAIGCDNARAGARRAFGKVVHTNYDLTKADVVLSLDADFLAPRPGGVRLTRDFSSRRRLRTKGAPGVSADQMNRLYAVESMFTLTGSNAEHRLPVKPSQVEAFARRSPPN